MPGFKEGEKAQLSIIKWLMLCAVVAAVRLVGHGLSPDLEIWLYYLIQSSCSYVAVLLVLKISQAWPAFAIVAIETVAILMAFAGVLLAIMAEGFRFTDHYYTALDGLATLEIIVLLLGGYQLGVFRQFIEMVGHRFIGLRKEEK